MFKTDYKDAVYTGNRLYNIVAQSGGNSTITDVTTYEQEGDRVGAAEMNNFGKAFNRMDNSVDVTLPSSGWSNTAPYTQTVNVSGVLGSDVPIMGYAIDSDTEPNTAKLYKKYTAMIDAFETADGSVMFYCLNKKPASDFKVRLKGVSNG